MIIIMMIMISITIVIIVRATPSLHYKIPVISDPATGKS